MTDEGDRLTYQSPLGQRYASPAMQVLWGDRRRIGLWRRLWLALMEAEQELGLDDPGGGDGGSPGASRRRRSRSCRRATRSGCVTTSWRTSTISATRPPRRVRSCTSAPPARMSRTTPTCILMREGLQLLLGRRRRRGRGARQSGTSLPRPSLPRLHAFPARAAHDRREACDAVDAGFPARCR